MKLSDVASLMDEQHKNDANLSSGCWAEEDAAPYGIVKTKEQYDYIKYYSDNTSIAFKLNDFESCVGKYISMGSYFGGASFYFYATDNFDDVYGNDLSFCYGKYGKIEF